jgi:hypothetical protein
MEMQQYQRSKAGIAASIVFISLICLGRVYQAISSYELPFLEYLVLAIGAPLLTRAVLDFPAPTWVKRAGFLAAAFLSVILLLQFLSVIFQNRTLFFLVHYLWGLQPWVEGVCLFWGAWVCFNESRGKTRVFGFVAFGLVICQKIYAFIVSFKGVTVPGSYRFVVLLAFVWLLLESRKLGPPKPLSFEHREIRS